MQIFDKPLVEVKLAVAKPREVEDLFCDPVHLEVMVFVRQIHHFTDFFRGHHLRALIAGKVSHIKF